MATSGLLYKDEVHRGKEARTYLDPLLFFFATIMTRVFTDEVVRVIKKHQSQHAVSFDLLQESSLCPRSLSDLGLVSVHERQLGHKHFVPRHTSFCCYILLNASSRNRVALDGREQEGK